MTTNNRLLLGIALGDYFLEELVRQTPHGPLFLARHQMTNANFIILVIVTEELPVQAHAYFLNTFQQSASQLQVLRHPYIVPILEVGYQNGIPFLVYPHVSTRTFSSRIDHNGPFDALTAGRYLDQIAGALEYAHEHTVIHGALSTDMLFLQRDGRLMVAGLGIHQILEKSWPDSLGQLAYQNPDAAPEQLLGQPASVATDVYAIGAMLHKFLTGHPVYAGRTSQEIVQQILYAPIPLISQFRSGLPSDLSDLIAQALAKPPESRFMRPGVLANAYHQIVDPQNTTRIPFVEGESINEGQSAGRFSERQNSGKAPLNVAQSTPLPPLIPPQQISLAPSTNPSLGALRLNRIRLIAGIALTVLLVGFLGFSFLQRHFSPTATSATGLAHFFDVHGNASAGLTITSNGLPSLPTGSQYEVWLIDPINEQVIPIGALSLQGHAYTLDYQGNNTGNNLLGAGSQIEITREQRQQPTAPVGPIELTGIFPPATFVHIRHLLFSFPSTPGKIGLLSGVLSQTQLLSAEAQQLQTEGIANSAHGHCLVLGMLATLEGTAGTHYHPLPTSCQSFAISPGDGFGLLPTPTTPGSTEYGDTTGYLGEASAHATLAIQQRDVTAPIRTHASRVIVALGNIKAWANTLDANLVALLKSPTDTASLNNIISLAEKTYAGQPNSGTNQDPTTGGATFAYAEGQLMADLPLVAQSH